MSRHIDVGHRGHGPVRVIFHDPTFDKPMTLADKVKAHMTFQVNQEALKAIDRDYQRGGFPAHMRHAR